MLTPRPYQTVGRDFLAPLRIGLLADEMRVGKTGTAILAAQKVGAERSLVLCPAIAVPMWQARWRDWWADGPRPSVYSYERGLILADQILAQEWDAAIIDECHFAGNPEAKRTKMIYGKDGIGWRSKHLWALSGTPAPKHAGSLWPILRAAGVIGMDYTSFIRRYCRIDFLSQRPVGTKEEMIPELRALWQKIGLRRTKKEVAPDMPDIGFNFLQMDPVKGVDLRAGDYSTNDDQLLANIERHSDVDREDRVEVAMAKAGQLIHEIEFALVNNLLTQTVVFGWHVDALRKVTSCLRAMGFTAEMISGETSQARRVTIEQQFGLGLIDVVVGQIRACGTAISLPCKHGYFLELDWVPGNNLQAANRCVVMMDSEPVTMDICTWPGSTDDRVQNVLLRRARELAKLF